MQIPSSLMCLRFLVRQSDKFPFVELYDPKDGDCLNSNKEE